MSGFSIRRADWTRDAAALREVRTRVFVEEQQVPLDLEWDGLDADCMHALAVADGHPIGTGRLTPDGHIGRMAVLAPWRGRGVGAAILEHLMSAALQRGDPCCVLNAQVSAMGFYERYGFRSEGEIFLDAGIEHQRMRLDYAQAGKLAFRGYENMASALLRVVRSARHVFALYAPDLAPRLCDHAVFAQAVKAIALAGPRSRVRLLVADLRGPVQSDHALLHVTSALPSHCAVHMLDAQDEVSEEVYAFNDTGDVFRQPRLETATAILTLDSPPAVRLLERRFEPLWERSTPASEGRYLNL